MWHVVVIDGFMRVTILALLVLMLVNTSAAPQSNIPGDPLDVVVLKFSWNDYVNRPDRDRDLYLNPIEAGDAELNQKEQHRAPHNRTLPPILPPEPKYKRKQADRAIKGFQYKVAIRNAGAKVIRTVEWDYIFIDPGEGKEVARHSFVSRKAIRPGQSEELIHFSISPPTKVVSAGALGSGEARRPFTERVIVKRIIYADRSWWQRP